MDSNAFSEQKSIEWSVTARPMAGEVVPGDLYLVKFFADGVLLAVVDGVGHGDEAALAAETAVSVLRAKAEEPVISLIKSCHAALTKTRGVVMTVASLHLSDNTLTWVGVGNVEGRLLRAGTGADHSSESILLRNGLVGYQLPPLQAGILSIGRNDLLIFATDGVHVAFDQGVNVADTPQNISDRIMHRWFKGTDDALTLVVRYLGRSRE